MLAWVAELLDIIAKTDARVSGLEKPFIAGGHCLKHISVCKITHFDFVLYGLKISWV